MKAYKELQEEINGCLTEAKSKRNLGTEIDPKTLSAIGNSAIKLSKHLRTDFYDIIESAFKRDNKKVGNIEYKNTSVHLKGGELFPGGLVQPAVQGNGSLQAVDAHRFLGAGLSA